MRLALLALAAFCAMLPAQTVTGSLAPPVSTDDRIAVYQGWAAADPTNIQNQTLLAAAYIQKTRETTDFSYLDRAAKIIDKVLAGRRDYEALRLRNLIELNRHHFSQVAEYSRELTKSAPRDPQNWGTLGDALMEMGRYGDAAEAYRQMMALRPNLFSYNRMAYYRFVTGDVEGAIAMMSKAVAAGAAYPENKAWCQTELGNIYFKTARWEEAAGAYRSALETFPGLHSAWAGLAAVQAAQGKLHDAIESYRRAQAAVPMPQYIAALADLYTLTGRHEESRRQQDLVDVVFKMEQAANQKANRTLALVYSNQDRKLAEALDLAKADLEVRQDVYSYDALAWALYKNHKYEEAHAAAVEALRLGTPEAMFHYHAGMIAAARHRNEEAASHLAKALELNPRFDPRQSAIAAAALRDVRQQASTAVLSK
jgi:tetratricopeptide (TPR) repeat protein